MIINELGPPNIGCSAVVAWLLPNEPLSHLNQGAFVQHTLHADRRIKERNITDMMLELALSYGRSVQDCNERIVLREEDLHNAPEILNLRKKTRRHLLKKLPLVCVVHGNTLATVFKLHNGRRLRIRKRGN